MRGGIASESAQALPELVLDRASPVPLYFQIAQQLQAAIDSRCLTSGARIPGEVELAERLGVSRPTLRQAIDRLVEQGSVIRQRGIGTTIAPKHVMRPATLSSLYDDLSLVDRAPSTKVLRLEEGACDLEGASALKLAHGAPVLVLERLRYADGHPLGLMHNLFPIGLIRLDIPSLETQGLYSLMQAQGVHFHTGDQTVGARLATVTESRLLETPRRAPVLSIVRTAYDLGGRPVEFGRHCYRADRYSYEMHLASR